MSNCLAASNGSRRNRAAKKHDDLRPHFGPRDCDNNIRRRETKVTSRSFKGATTHFCESCDGGVKFSGTIGSSLGTTPIGVLSSRPLMTTGLTSAVQPVTARPPELSRNTKLSDVFSSSPNLPPQCSSLHLLPGLQASAYLQGPAEYP